MVWTLHNAKKCHSHYCTAKQIMFTITFAFMHLADSFIQSETEFKVHISSVLAFPGNQTHAVHFKLKWMMLYLTRNALFYADVLFMEWVCLWLTQSVLCFSPFYSEDFYFEIPRPFQCLSFYVYAKSMFQIRGDIPVGQYLSPLFCLIYKTNAQCTCQLKLVCVCVCRESSHQEGRSI